MEITDKITNPIEIVNQFIASSFGKGWRGDCFFYSFDRFRFRDKKTLHIIGKPSKIENFFYNRRNSYQPRYIKIAGQLGDGRKLGDGSVIVVFQILKSRQ